MKHWGNLPFRLETQDLDWCSRAGLAVAVRNLLCLPAHFDVPDLVTAFRCHKPHRNYIKKHTTALCPSHRDSHVLIKSTVALSGGAESEKHYKVTSTSSHTDFQSDYFVFLRKCKKNCVGH